MFKAKIFKLSMEVKSMNITKRVNFGKGKPRRKKLFPFHPGNFEHNDMLDHELVEWHYSNVECPCHPRFKDKHIWVDVSSDL